MKTDGLSDTVDKDCIRDRLWDDVGCVEFEKVRLSEHGLVGNVSDHHQQEEDPSYQVDESADYAMPDDG